MDSLAKIEKLFWQMKLFFRLPLMTVTFGEAAFNALSGSSGSGVAELAPEISAQVVFRVPLVILVETLFLGSQAYTGRLTVSEAVKVIIFNTILAVVYFGTVLAAMVSGAPFGLALMALATLLAVGTLILCTHYALIRMILPFFGIKAKVADVPKNSDFGQCQSPINIDSMCSKNVVIPDSEFHRNPLHFNYPHKVPDCSVLNNGYTVQVDMNQKKKCTLSIHNKTYTLRQFHFHTPSEHTMNSVQYEMEMHLVHTTEKGEIAVLAFVFGTNPACKTIRPMLRRSPSRGHLVMAPIGEDKDPSASYVTESEDSGDDTALPEADKDANQFLAQFWHALPEQKTEKNIPLKKAISFDYLFQTAAITWIKTVSTGIMDVDMELFEYVGSLTTPPFTEGVQWLVSHKLHYISPQQLVVLRNCWNNKNNAREVQDMSGRSLSFRRRTSLRRM